MFDDIQNQRRRKQLIDAGWIEAGSSYGRYWQRPDKVVVTEEEAFRQLQALIGVRCRVAACVDALEGIPTEAVDWLAAKGKIMERWEEKWQDQWQNRSDP